MPNLRGADQPHIRAQGCQRYLHAFGGNKKTILPDDLVNAVEEQARTFHYAAAQHDGFGNKQGDNIGETDTQVIGLALDRPPEISHELP